MKRINLILLIGMALICSAEGAGNSEEPIRYDRAWGRLNYTAFSHLDVTFDQTDLRHVKSSMIPGSLKIPNGVTHVFLKLSGSFDLIEFPETVKFVNKDIFDKCNVKTILLNDKTAERLLRKGTGENTEENLRKYFSLNDNIEIIVNGSNKTQNPNFSAPEKPEATPENPLLNEIRNFDRSKLKTQEPQERPKTWDPLAKELLEKIEYQEDDTNKASPDDTDWED
jgi:hypothetical protein